MEVRITQVQGPAGTITADGRGEGASWACSGPTSFRNTSLLFLASSLEVSASAVLGFFEA